VDVHERVVRLRDHAAGIERFVRGAEATCYARAVLLRQLPGDEHVTQRVSLTLVRRVFGEQHGRVVRCPVHHVPDLLR
jgi:hypothetical protein